MTVVLIRGHGLLAPLFPEPRIFAELAEGARHFPNVNGYRAATGANVIDPYLASSESVVTHFLAGKLQGIESQRELRQASKVRFVARRAISNRLASQVAGNRLAHLFH